MAAPALTGCGRKTDQAPSAAVDSAAYLAPPTLAAAARDANGATLLSGRAPGDAEVRLRDPQGEAFSATANDGAWSILLPPAPDARMFSFEGEASGRVLHGEGAVLVLPAPGPVAVLARAGYGALVIGGGAGPLRIATIDYDGAGGGAVSGLASPHAPVRFMLDGNPVGAGQADDQGRFTVLDLSARRPFGRGDHSVRIESQTGAVQGQVTVAAAAPLGDAPFRATREPGAWRADWRTPGGGTQTTVVFDAPAAAASGSAQP